MSKPADISAKEPSGPAYFFGLYLGFRLFIMLLVVVVLGLTPQAGVIVDLAIGFLLFAVVLFCSLGGSRRDLHLLRTGSSQWVILFLAFTGCSLAWSVAASLPAAVVYWCALAANCSVVVLLMRTQSVKSVVQQVLKGFAHGGCMVAIVAWLLPGTDDLRLGYDGLIGTNVIGYLCALAFYCAQYLVVVRKQSTHWR